MSFFLLIERNGSFPALAASSCCSFPSYEGSRPRSHVHDGSRDRDMRQRGVVGGRENERKV